MRPRYSCCHHCKMAKDHGPRDTHPLPCHSVRWPEVCAEGSRVMGR